MNNNRNILAVITARGGSKGLPRKNLLSLGGYPLITWTIRAALNAKCIDRVIVSTDNIEIADVAVSAGADVPFIRPAELASDTATSVDVLKHALDNVTGYESAVLLQPTSPFRTALDIDAGFALWQTAPGSSGCVSVCETVESPWLMYRRSDSGILTGLMLTLDRGIRRQDLPKTVILNGAFYFFDIDRFRMEEKIVFSDSLGFEMPIERSQDIDTVEDFVAAELQLANWHNKIPQSTI
jgi:CMP-N,N'-diacetyllegionaminic acid synthase